MEAIGRLMDQGGEVSNILTHGNLTPDQLNNGKAGPAGMPSNMANMDDGNSNIKVFQKLSNEDAGEGINAAGLQDGKQAAGTDYMKKQKSIKLDLKQASIKKNSGVLVRKSSDLNKDTFRGHES